MAFKFDKITDDERERNKLSIKMASGSTTAKLEDNEDWLDMHYDSGHPHLAEDIISDKERQELLASHQDEQEQQEQQEGEEQGEGEVKKAFDELFKGRVGRHKDNPENRRLKRVGQQYGQKKQEEVSGGRARKLEQDSGKTGEKEVSSEGKSHKEIDTPREVSTKLEGLAKMAREAKEKGKAAPNFNLCEISIPNTNLFCKDNKGVVRAKMPQLKGEAAEGTEAAEIAKKTGEKEVDGEEMFKKHLKDIGIKMTSKDVPAETLKSTQNELVGVKVAGMTEALKKDPNHPAITAPIFVSKDGYVLDGHHRWAAHVGLKMAKDKPVDMAVIEVDMSIEELLKESNKWAGEFGIAQKEGKVDEKPSGKAWTTTDKHKVDGQYTPERYKDVHVGILNKIWHEAGKAQDKPTLIFMGGGSASGKSTILNDHVLKGIRSSGSTVGLVDSDAIKDSIPEYGGFKKEDVDSAAKRVHTESSDIAKHATEKLIDGKRNLVLDGTMRNPNKYLALLEHAKEKGYDVQVVIADVGVDEAKKRSDARAEKTGRKVPHEIIEASHKGASSTFQKLKDIVDDYHVYSTEGGGELIASKDGVFNEKLYDSFVKKGGGDTELNKVLSADADSSEKSVKKAFEALGLVKMDESVTGAPKEIKYDRLFRDSDKEVKKINKAADKKPIKIERRYLADGNGNRKVVWVRSKL